MPPNASRIPTNNERCIPVQISALPPEQKLLPYVQCVRPYSDVISNSIKSRGRWRDCDLLVSLWRQRSRQHPEAGRRELYVDAGANIGSCALLMMSLGVVTHAFEPLPANLFYLRSSMDRNPSFHSLLHLHEEGLGARAGTLKMYTQIGNAGNTVLGAAVSDPGTVREMREQGMARTTTLDTALWPNSSSAAPLIPLKLIRNT